MEIQGLCWNKQALPQCGWFACRGIIWSNYFPCRHIQLVCPLNVNIFIMSNIKVTAQCQISLCRTVILYRALHISFNMKLLCFLEEKKKSVQKICKLLMTDGYIRCAIIALSHEKTVYKLQRHGTSSNLWAWLNWYLPSHHLFHVLTRQCDLFKVGVNVHPWRKKGGQRTKNNTQVQSGGLVTTCLSQSGLLLP